MFYCIGENESMASATGCGETVAEAIKSWSTAKNVWSDIIEEFNTYGPHVIQGEELTVELEIPEPVIKIS